MEAHTNLLEERHQYEVAQLTAKIAAMEEEAVKKKNAADELRETMQQRIDLLTQKLKASEER